jgi:hypothetical protein
MRLTAAIVGTNNYELMSFAIKKTINSAPCNKVLVCSDKKIDLPFDYDFVHLNDKLTLGTYSEFCIKELGKYVNTDHVLLTQYDGFAVNNFAWNDKFLEYDFIGSLIHPYHTPMYKTLQTIGTEKSKNIIKEKEWINGGGGFTLRSKKLLEIMVKDDNILPYIPTNNPNNYWLCEDLSISVYLRDYLEKEKQIKFAPVKDSLNFSSEITTGYGFSLGFHGWYNIPLFLTEEEVFYYMKNLEREVKIDKTYVGLFLGFLLSKKYNKAFKEFKEKLYD